MTVSDWPFDDAPGPWEDADSVGEWLASLPEDALGPVIPASGLVCDNAHIRDLLPKKREAS